MLACRKSADPDPDPPGQFFELTWSRQKQLCATSRLASGISRVLLVMQYGDKLGVQFQGLHWLGFWTLTVGQSQV